MHINASSSLSIPLSAVNDHLFRISRPKLEHKRSDDDNFNYFNKCKYIGASKRSHTVIIHWLDATYHTFNFTGR